MTEVSVEWVPQLLIDEHHTARLCAALKFLSHYHMDENEFLKRIVTGDES